MEDQPKKILINGKGHIAGRLASRIAKLLLEGAEVSVVHCELISYAFPKERARKIYDDYLRKRCVVNPRKGPYHYVEPSKYFTRMVKRMLPHKITRGANALKRLSCFESLPAQFADEELNVCPVALIKYKANPIRKSCTFGVLLKDYGWKHFGIVEEMNKKFEDERERSYKESERKKENIKNVLASKGFQKEVNEILLKIE